MKECTICKNVKDESEFHIRRKAVNSLYTYCKDCHRNLTKRHYNSNKKYYSDKRLRQNKKVSNWLRDYKSQLKCEICSENHPATLDFHHTDPSTKRGHVSSLIHLNSIEVLKEEILKCKVLCSNCHRKLHWKEV